MKGLSIISFIKAAVSILVIALLLMSRTSVWDPLSDRSVYLGYEAVLQLLAILFFVFIVAFEDKGIGKAAGALGLVSQSLSIVSFLLLEKLRSDGFGSSSLNLTYSIVGYFDSLTYIVFLILLIIAVGKRSIGTLVLGVTIILFVILNVFVPAKLYNLSQWLGTSYSIIFNCVYFAFYLVYGMFCLKRAKQ